MRGINLVSIEDSWVREVDRIIFEELAAGRVVRDSQRKLKTLITELQKQKVQAVVLGCTELVMAVDVRANVLPVYDTTAIHARARSNGCWPMRSPRGPRPDLSRWPPAALYLIQRDQSRSSRPTWSRRALQ